MNWQKAINVHTWGAQGNVSRLTPCSYFSPVCGYLYGNWGSLVRARKSTLRLVRRRVQEIRISEWLWSWAYFFRILSDSRLQLFWIRCYVEGVKESGECCRLTVKESCVLDVKSGTALIISSVRVLVFNCSLKARYLFCNWKYRLAFSSSRRSFRESTSSMLPCISCIAWRSGTWGERFCCFRYFRSSWGIFSWNPAWLKPSSLGRTFVRSRHSSWVVNFISIRR